MQSFKKVNHKDLGNQGEDVSVRAYRYRARETGITHAMQMCKKYKIGLRWSASELDLEACRGRLHPGDQRFCSKDWSSLQCPGKSLLGGPWVCDRMLKMYTRRLKSLPRKAGEFQVKAEQSALDARK